MQTHTTQRTTSMPHAPNTTSPTPQIRQNTEKTWCKPIAFSDTSGARSRTEKRRKSRQKGQGKKRKDIKETSSSLSAQETPALHKGLSSQADPHVKTSSEREGLAHDKGRSQPQTSRILTDDRIRHIRTNNLSAMQRPTRRNEQRACLTCPTPQVRPHKSGKTPKRLGASPSPLRHVRRSLAHGKTEEKQAKGTREKEERHKGNLFLPVPPCTRDSAGFRQNELRGKDWHK